DEVNLFSSQPIERRRLQAVAVAQALRDEVDDVGAEQFERPAKDDRRRDSINVVVTMDRDALTSRDRTEDPIHGDRHVGQRESIQQIIQRGVEKTASAIEFRDAANAQKSSGDRSHSQLLNQRVRLCVVALKRLPQTLDHAKTPNSQLDS